MDGKNIADFIDPDIADKLEALEREEETLEAEGFYDDRGDMVSPTFPTTYFRFDAQSKQKKQFDSDDEREAAAAKVALGYRLEAQSKKKMKNKARLPRTAGLRTITDLTTDLTKAGLDPSRIQERATMIAKVRGAAARKRTRDEDEDGMDVDVDDDDEAASEWVEENADTMEIDGNDDDDDDDTPRKRGKANSGAAIVRKRAPHSNRQLAGLRDEAVRVLEEFSSFAKLLIYYALRSVSKHPRPYGCEISASVGATCSQKQARAIARSESKWCVLFFPLGRISLPCPFTSR
jgi:nucleolar GTP-binding protein